MKIGIIPDSEGVLATFVAPFWDVTCFGASHKVILTLHTHVGTVAIHHDAQHVCLRGPEIAVMYGIALSASDIAVALERCREAIAEETA